MEPKKKCFGTKKNLILELISLYGLAIAVKNLKAPSFLRVYLGIFEQSLKHCWGPLLDSRGDVSIAKYLRGRKLIRSQFILNTVLEASHQTSLSVSEVPKLLSLLRSLRWALKVSQMNPFAGDLFEE